MREDLCTEKKSGKDCEREADSGWNPEAIGRVFRRISGGRRHKNEAHKGSLSSSYSLNDVVVWEKERKREKEKSSGKEREGGT